VNTALVIANGMSVETKLPCSLGKFLVAQKLLPRSVVVTFRLKRFKLAT